MPSSARDPLHRLVSFDARPRYWRPLVAVEGSLVAALAAVTVAVAALDHNTAVEPLYDILLRAVLFYAPPVLGAICAVLDGGLLQAIALGTVPALVWALAIVVGDAVQAVLSIPAAIPDSPLWAIAGTALVIGVVSALAGFAVGRAGLLVWGRRGSGGEAA
ncbi:hypothetical protein [Halobaculum marinum]|uniref:Uncharacterized protein n=1 Tax=Halobaculum marinum TaxID=3031996 RepID=A0ABD5WVA9_9EURY|nr:hypothetical protein [Halobaculum sp. DT55]